ncbi:MAG: class I SAM-dependent methyltransferase, partial [Actinomyces sp.]|nr:class I SAM-dependent methyltransferase [Actinomyces sp.]
MKKSPEVGTIRADETKKPDEVAAMFDVVAPNYDLANDVISLGQVYLWRRAV